MRFLAICVLAVPLLGGPPTFYRDVLPILQNRCQACHRPGEIAPFPLMTYDQARPWAKAIKAAVISSKMPPWFAEGGHFANDRSLSAAEIKTITGWAESPTPGDAKDAPAPVRFTDGWRIDKPDAVFDTGVDFPIPASGQLSYQFFVVHTNFKEDRWVREIDIRPGNPSVVHHIGLYVRPPGSKFMSHVTPGRIFVPSKAYIDKPFFGPAPQGNEISVKGLEDSQAAQVFAYLPGFPSLRLPKGQAYLIPAGSDLVFEIHYTTTGAATQDRSKVGLVFSEPPAKRSVTAVLMNLQIRIPAQASNHRIEGDLTLTDDAEVSSIQAHMHLRGVGFELHAIYPNGTDETLLKLRRYDFNWQIAHELERPILLPKGTTLKMTGTWDNSANNRANPNPNVEVAWGDQTTSEMLAAFLRLSVPMDKKAIDIAPRSAIFQESDPFEEGSLQDAVQRSLLVWKYRLGIH